VTLPLRIDAPRTAVDGAPVAVPAAGDEALIARIGAGDKLAMRALFARHHLRIYRFVLRFVRDSQIAEDLISEVFLEVWRHAGKFEARSAATTWLLSIARHKALSRLRRRTDARLDDATAAAIEDTADDPERSARSSKARSCALAWRGFRQTTAKSSISSTIREWRSARSPRSSASPKAP
jgi:DNA-directed RNA polymerase specialized sigma24 family protein